MSDPPSATADHSKEIGATDEHSASSEEAPEQSASSWSRLQHLVLQVAERHLPTSDADGSSVDPPPRRTGSYARWLPLLRALPWLLVAVFGLSFAWDFPGVTLTVAGYTIVLEDLLRYTTVSGLIGFGTNWLAITMLFRPREPRPLVGQGLVPAQRERVAYRLAQAVSDELINKTIIMEKIRESGLVARYRALLVATASDVVTDDAVRDELRGMLRALLRDVLSTPSVQDRIVEFTAQQMEEHAGEGLSGLALRTYRLFGEADFRARLREAVQRLPESIDPLLEEMDPVLDRLPAKLERRSDAIESLLTQLILRLVETIDLERIIFENVRAYDEQQLELLLQRTTNEQLNYIKYLGAVLGVIGGFIIWAPTASLAVFTTLGLTIYAVDETLYRMRSAPETSS